MSKIGKIPVKLPNGVAVEIKQTEIILSASGKTLSFDIPEGVCIEKVDSVLNFSIKENTKHLKSLWGTLRSLVQNAVYGLVKPFQKKLEFVGVGYKVAVVGKNVEMQLAFSHDIKVAVPDDVSVKAEKQTTLLVESYDKQSLGAFLKLLQKYRLPEPYKGKGIIIENQYVYRKEGKKK